jgi:hypothetical protein
MTKFIHNETNHIVYLTKNENIDTSKVYNQSFFSIFPLDGIRVFKDMSGKHNESDIERPTIIKSDNNQSDKVINILGNEHTPNSYTELPLQTSEIKDEDIGSNSTDDEDESFYSNLSSYLSKYISGAIVQENQDSHGMKIIIHTDIQDPIYTWDEYLKEFNDNNNMYAINQNQITYDSLYLVLKDIFIQLDYLKNAGFFFTKFDKKKLLRVQERFVYFDGDNISVYENKPQINDDMNKSIIEFIRDILGLNNDEEVVEQIKNIQHTQLYYFIKRIEREGVILWL